MLHNDPVVSMATEASTKEVSLAHEDAESVSSNDEVFMETVEFINVDINVAQAALNAAVTGTLTPLIKEELRVTIQSKRLSEGKDELQVEITEDQPHQPSPEEEERRRRRREHNRLAAQRCRGKKRERAECLQMESEELEDKNKKLRQEVEKLEEERETLMAMLNNHKPLCIHKKKKNVKS